MSKIKEINEYAEEMEEDIDEIKIELAKKRDR